MPEEEAPFISKCLGEFVGTSVLVFTVGCNVLAGQAAFAGLSIGCALMVVIYSIGGISGANFNPAVSIALGLTKSLGGKGIGSEWAEVGAYTVVQLLAGIVAAEWYMTLLWGAFPLGPAKNHTLLQAGLCEIIYTFMLCFVVLNVAVANKSGVCDRNQYFGLAIGFVIIAGAHGAGPVSGACFNPAVAVGIDSAAATWGLKFGMCWLYAVFELIGAVIAAILFRVVRPEEFEGTGRNVTAPVPAPELVSEFVGTFLLCTTVGLNVLASSHAAILSISASLLCMVYALGDISGAHFNPAVTIAVYVSKLDEELTGIKAVLYILVQLLAGVAAHFTYSAIYSGSAFYLGPQPGFQWEQAMIGEFLFTAVLCLVVISVAVSAQKEELDDIKGLAIGSCILVGGGAIGTISGACLNPAVSLATAMSFLKVAEYGKCLGYFCLYSVAQILGGLCAAGVIVIVFSTKSAKSGFSTRASIIGRV